MLNKLSESGKQYCIAVLLFLITTTIWVWGFNTSYLTRLDAHDYAQMGREISEGNGFSTLQTFPRHIRYFHERGFLEEENSISKHDKRFSVYLYQGYCQRSDITIRDSISFECADFFSFGNKIDKHNSWDSEYDIFLRQSVYF